MRKGIAGNFNAFKVEREDGALMGPWVQLRLHGDLGRTYVVAGRAGHGVFDAAPL
jgi:hypothetical protein